MAIEDEFTLRYQADHIKINIGNVFAIGLISLLWYGLASWTSAYLANTNIPGASQLAIGAQTYLHAA